MRVIAGEARGRRLEALPGTDITRPTLDQVKEAMFSIVQFDLPGARVLDLYAGSGQLGIEALSRGAARCVFLDENREAVNIVMKNCKNCGVFDRSRVNIGEAARFLSACREQFDLVLLDPPFHNGTLENILPIVDKCVAPGGIVICAKNAEALRDVFGSGAARAICGSIAVTQPDAFREWLAEFGSAKMILGADTRDGRIAINGWLEAATVGVEELIGSFRDAGLSQVICTDIAKDGMLSGPSVPLYLQLQKTFPEIDITVSGGISSWEDIEELDRNGLRSVVVGKAIYEGRIRFEQLEKYMLTVRTDKKQQRC